MSFKFFVLWMVSLITRITTPPTHINRRRAEAQRDSLEDAVKVNEEGSRRVRTDEATKSIDYTKRCLVRNSLPDYEGMSTGTRRGWERSNRWGGREQQRGENSREEEEGSNESGGRHGWRRRREEERMRRKRMVNTREKREETEVKESRDEKKEKE